MRFIPSTQWKTYSNATSKTLTWKVYWRTVSNLSGSLAGYVGWTDDSSRVISIGDITEQVEYDTGEFTINNVNMEMDNVSYWATNLFTDSFISDTTTFAEFKIEVQIGLGNIVASDTPPVVFSGTVDKSTLEFNETDNSVKFNIVTAEAIAQNMPAEMVGQLYYTDNVYRNTTHYSSVESGTILQNIPGLYCHDFTNNPLPAGTHTINFKVNSGNPTLDLDGGTPIYMNTASFATYSLQTPNPTGLTGSAFTLKLYQDANAIYLPNDTTNEIIKKTSTAGYPYQWPVGAAVQNVLAQMYSNIGISCSFSNMNISTWDNRVVSSFLEIPPNNPNVVAWKQCIVSDGTDMYLGVGSTIYKRTTSDGTYTASCVLPLVTGSIQRMFYNKRNNHIWTIYGADTNHLSTTVFNTKTFSTSSKLPIGHLNGGGSGNSSLIGVDSMALIDYNYSGANWAYGLYYTNEIPNPISTDVGYIIAINSGSSGFVSSSAYISPVFGNLQVGDRWPMTNLMFQYGSALIIQTLWYPNGTYNYTKFLIGAPGNSSLTPSTNYLMPGTEPRVYGVSKFNDVDNNFYYQYSDGSDIITLKYAPISNLSTGKDCSYTDINNKIVPFTLKNINDIYFQSGSGLSSAYLSATDDSEIGNVYSVNNGIVTYISPGNQVAGLNSITSVGSDVYYLDLAGNLNMIRNNFPLWMNNTSFKNQTLYDAIKQILNSFNLVAKISSNKVAYIFPRGTLTGTPITNLTTGQSTSSLFLDVSRVEDITRKSDILKADVVKFSNSDTNTSYSNGVFGAIALLNAKTIQVNATNCPDSILKDMCYYTYQFFNKSYSTYTLPLITKQIFEYETLDNINLSFPTSKLNVLSIGDGHPIYKIIYKFTGDSEVTALI